MDANCVSAGSVGLAGEVMNTQKKGPTLTASTQGADPILFPWRDQRRGNWDCNKRLPRSMQKQSNRDSRQLKLPIDAVPPLLIDHGLRDAHPFPLVKWHKSEVTRRGGRRVPTAEAFSYPLVRDATGEQ